MRHGNPRRNAIAEIVNNPAIYLFETVNKPGQFYERLPDHTKALLRDLKPEDMESLRPVPIGVIRPRYR